MSIFYVFEKFKNNGQYVISVIVAVIFLVLMISFPESTLFSTRKALNLWANNIVPSLLPFFICINFMSNIGITKFLRPELFPFFMSVLSGYPVGAKILGDMCREGIIDKRKCKQLVSFCSTSGPGFILGTIGTAFLGNNLVGLIIMVSHYLGVLANGAFFFFVGNIFDNKEKGHIARKNKCYIVDRKCNYDNILDCLTNGIISAFKSLGIVMAYVVIFMILTDAMVASGMLDSIENGFVLGMIKGMLEMTVGCASIGGDVAIPMLYRTIGCSVLVSFGGLSIIGQSLSMLSNTGISFGYLMLVKLFHGIFAGSFAYIVMSLIY